MGALGHWRHSALSFASISVSSQVKSMSGVSFDNVHPVLPWSSRLSFIACQFPLCHLTGCPGVIHSQDVSQPSQFSFFNYVFQLSWTSFLSDVFVPDFVFPDSVWKISDFKCVCCDVWSCRWVAPVLTTIDCWNDSVCFLMMSLSVGWPASRPVPWTSSCLSWFTKIWLQWLKRSGNSESSCWILYAYFYSKQTCLCHKCITSVLILV